MKIGIITFHDCSNYGAAFQMFGLYKTLKKNGFDVEVIDYKNIFISSDLQLKNMKKIKSIKGLVRFILFYNKYKTKKEKFDDFLKKYIKLSKETYYSNNIFDSNKIYDAFITGSDQVFNLNLTREDYNYLLSFVEQNKLKLSYAASIGQSSIKEDFIENFKKYILKLDNILIRENNAKEILNKIGIKNCNVVLDPSFLIEKKEWESISKKIDIPKNYILLYLVSPTEENFYFARKLSNLKKIPIIYINYKPTIKKGVINKWGVSPEEFLFLLKNSTYVITNSFHGTALSINLNKQFFYELSKKENNANSRIIELIEKFNLTNREIINYENEYIDCKINYEKINKNLEDERNICINILKNSIERKKDE